MMKQRLSVIAGLFTAGLLISSVLSGCGTAAAPAGNLNDPNNSLVLGYIDMEDAPTPATSATIAPADASGSNTWKAPVNDGLFTLSLPPGSYELSNISGSKFMEGESQYKFPRQNSDTTLNITKPGIYFLGSFKYRKVKSLYFEEKNFLMEKVGKPTEAELLQRILENRAISNSGWGEKIRTRLAQLK
jgi:hypothetical protein